MIMKDGRCRDRLRDEAYALMFGGGVKREELRKVPTAEKAKSRSGVPKPFYEDKVGAVQVFTNKERASTSNAEANPEV